MNTIDYWALKGLRTENNSFTLQLTINMDFKIRRLNSLGFEQKMVNLYVESEYCNLTS